MSQKQQRQQKNNQKRPRDAASRLKREVERARTAKSKTSNVAPAQSAKGGEGSKRMNTLPPAATEAELKRRNYKDAKKKKEESNIQRQQVDVILTNVMFSNAATDKATGGVDLTFNAPAFDIFNANDLFVNEMPSIFNSGENLFADPKLPKELQEDRNEIVFQHKAISGYQPITQKQLDGYWIDKYGKVCPYQPANTKQHMPGSLAALTNPNPNTQAPPLVQQPAPVITKAISEDAYDRLSRKPPPCKRDPPKSAPSRGRRQEKTYLHYSGRNRGGGLIPDPTGSFKGPRDRTQVVSRRQQEIEEQRKRREITEEEYQEQRLSAEEEATLHIRAALLRISGEADSRNNNRDEIHESNDYNRAQGKNDDLYGVPHVDKREAKPNSLHEPMVNIMYMRPPNKQDHRIQSAPATSSPSGPYVENKGWDSNMAFASFVNNEGSLAGTVTPLNEDSSEIMTKDLLPDITSSKKTEQQQPSSLLLATSSYDAKQGSADNKNVSYEKIPTNNQDRYSHFKSPNPVHYTMKKIKPKSAPFARTTDRLTNEGNALSRIEKEIQWEQGKLAVTEERLKRSLATSSGNANDNNNNNNNNYNKSTIGTGNSVNSVSMSLNIGEMSSVELLNRGPTEDLLYIAKKSEPTKRDDSQVDPDTPDPIFVQTMEDLRKKFEYEDFRMRRVLRPRPHTSHVTGRQQQSIDKKASRNKSDTHQAKLDEELHQLKRRLEAQSYKMGGADLVGLFDKIDVDGGGTLELEELARHVKRLLPNMTDQEMKLLMSRLDLDGGGSIDRNEFVDFVGGKAAEIARKAIVQQSIDIVVAEKGLAAKKARFNENADHITDKFSNIQARTFYMETLGSEKTKDYEKSHEDKKHVDHLYGSLDNRKISIVHFKPKKAPTRTDVDVRKQQSREEMLESSKKNHSRFSKFHKPKFPVIRDMDLFPDKNLTDRQIARNWTDVSRALKIKPMMTETEIEQLFHRLDADHSGSLDASELKMALEEKGMLLSDEQIRSIISIVDEDHNGDLSLHEFVQLWKIVASINHKIEKEGARLNTVIVAPAASVEEEAAEPRALKDMADAVDVVGKVKKFKRKGLHIRTTENEKFSHILDLKRNEYDELEVVDDNVEDGRHNYQSELVELKDNPFMKMLSDPRFDIGSGANAASSIPTKETVVEGSIVEKGDKKEEKEEENHEEETLNRQQEGGKDEEMAGEKSLEVEMKAKTGNEFLQQIFQAHHDLHGLSVPQNADTEYNTVASNTTSADSIIPDMNFRNSRMQAMSNINKFGKNFLNEILHKKKELKETTILPRVEAKKLDRKRIDNWKHYMEGVNLLNISPLLAIDNVHVLTEGQQFEMSSMRPAETEGVQDNDTLNQYKDASVEGKHAMIDKMMGRGKFAAVYSGTLNRDEKVAFKIAQFTATSPQSDLYALDGVIVPPIAVCKTFLREIRVLDALKHSDYIVNMHLICVQPFFICLELLEGGDLYSSLDDDIWQHEISLHTRMRIMRDVAIGLRYLHHKGYVHRDLKPHNILLHYDVSAKPLVHIGTDDVELSDVEMEAKLRTQRNIQDKPIEWGGMKVVAKICDFGMAVKRHHLHESDRTTFAWLDDDVEGGGTSGYTAPEVLMDEDCFDLSTDVFSYGVCLWEATTSDRNNILAGKESKTTANHILNGVRPAFTSNQPIFLRKIIQSCWATGTQRRPKMEIIIQIFNELMSSPGAFMQLYNRKFFSDPTDGRRSKSGVENDANNHYYNIRPTSPEHVEEALKVNENSIKNIRILPNQGPDDPKSNRKFGPYNDRFDIITKAEEMIQKARAMYPTHHSNQNCPTLNHRVLMGHAVVKSLQGTGPEEEKCSAVESTSQSPPSSPTANSEVRTPNRSRGAFVRPVSPALISATASQHKNEVDVIDMLDRRAIAVEHDWQLHTDHHGALKMHIGQTQTMLISDEVTLRNVLCALDDKGPEYLNDNLLHNDAQSNDDEDDSLSGGSSSSSDSDDSSVKHLTLHQAHEIVVDHQDYEDKALFKYKDQHAIGELTNVKNTWKHRHDNKHTKNINKKRKGIITEKEESKVPAMAGITKVFNLEHNGKNKIHVGLIYIKLYCAKNLQNVDLVGTSDPFPRVTLGAHVEEGPVQENNLNPVWNMDFLMPWDGVSVLKVELLDEDVFDEVSESLGYIEVSLMLLEVDKTLRIDQPLKGVGKGTIKVDVTLKVLADDSQAQANWLII